MSIRCGPGKRKKKKRDKLNSQNELREQQLEKLWSKSTSPVYCCLCCCLPCVLLPPLCVAASPVLLPVLSDLSICPSAGVPNPNAAVPNPNAAVPNCNAGVPVKDPERWNFEKLTHHLCGRESRVVLEPLCAVCAT